MERLKPCRYLEGNTCTYYDETMGDEDTIRCYPGGWPCYEEDNGGCLFEAGQWMHLGQYSEWVIGEHSRRLPETLEVPGVFSARPCPRCQDLLVYTEGQPLITCRKCGAQYEREDK